MVGAGAGPWPEIGVNCEMMANANVDGESVDVKTKIAKVNTDTNKGESHGVTTDQFALLANFYMSKGNREGKVCI